MSFNTPSEQASHAEASNTNGLLEQVQKVVTDDELFSAYAKEEVTESLYRSAKKYAKKASSCSREKVKNIVHSVVPITQWLPNYKVKESLVNDIVAGITVGIVHLPQGLAYSLLTDLPAVNGLYVSFFPVLIYALFGTTRHLSVGTFAVVSLMIRESITKNVPPCPIYAEYISVQNFTVTTTASAIVTCPEIERRKVEIAIALSVAVALIHFCMYLFRLGVLHVFLSNHMVSGFTCGAAFHVFTSQIAKIFGIDVSRQSGPLAIVYTYIEFFSEITTINWATVIVSLCCIVVLVIGKNLNQRYAQKLPFPLPWELAVVVFSTVASAYAFLQPNYNVKVVGNIPQGIQTSIPIAQDIGVVFADAIPISIVIFSISISLSTVFSEKHAYEVDANQELLAYSLANLFGSFFQCFPCAASLSRSLVWEQSGGKSQITGFMSCILILITLLWIGPLFGPLPTAALAAIIIVNLKNMLLQFRKLKPLWKVSKIDSFTWVVTWLAVVLLGVDLGLYIGVGFSLFTVVLRTQITFGNVMVAVGPDQLYRSGRRFDGASDQDILVFRFPAPLIYANQSRFRHQLAVSLGFKPNFEVSLRKAAAAKKKSGEEAKPEAKPKRNRIESEVAEADAESDRKSSIRNRPANPTVSGAMNLKPTLVIENQVSTSAASASVDDSGNRTASNGVTMPRFVILDMSICPFIDNDGVTSIKALLATLSDLDIRLILARCSADVRYCLLNGGLPTTNDDDEPLFFVNIDKAVSYVKRRRISAVVPSRAGASSSVDRSTEVLDSRV